MSRLLPILFVAIGAMQPTPAAAAASPSVYGLWRNPLGTIETRIAPCGTRLCGTIFRASPEAERDARDAGVRELVGVQLLQHYRKVAPGRWKGRVYVPDMGGTFASRMVQLSPTQLKISGCMIGGSLCKSQLWTRL